MTTNVYQEVSDIVELAHTDWDKWKYAGEHMNYAHAIWCKIKQIADETAKQKVWSKVSTHQRLYTEVLRQKYLCEIGGCSK